jgi:hypothetical protein
MANPKQTPEVRFFPTPNMFGAPTVILGGVEFGPRVFIETEHGWQELRREGAKGLHPVQLTDDQSQWFYALVEKTLGVDFTKSA